MKNLLFRTAPGLEDMLKGEILKALRKTAPGTDILKASNGKGWVRVSIPNSWSPNDIAAGIPTAFRILSDCSIGARGESTPVTAAENMIQQCGSEQLTNRIPFRVTCYAGDEPSGTKRAVEQALGKKIVDKTGVPVNLTEYSINYGIEFIDRHIIFGVVLRDEENISQYRKQFQVRSSVRAI